MALSFLLPASSTSVTSLKLRVSNPRKPNSSRTHQWRTSITTCSTRTHEATLAKNDLYELISGEERGVKTEGNPSKRSKIIKAIDAMEVLGKGSITTGSSLSATWRMLWTTEKEQLFIIKNANFFGTQTGDVLQVIDVERGILNNVITFPPSGVFFVRSNIEVASPQRVNFRFTSAVLRGKDWEFPLPPFGQGWFESIYLDDEIQVAKDIRGDCLVVDRALYSWRE
ncbi:probable plastid-lipid-associated protein 11, chloroplastic isoform X2 [Macadamia integrifolia]|uniref:probable plastid-lipid-associated protein 11, chloroplastic isoform X2 n=1 Tax=Macadamia integrifolia TaxID=60698 RepID=UPI001C4EC817|nr:probable plastid-lipid-associated protein 11, chloroplastic isoform X2 [Macadamia integrifolia]XP_042484002.1 probable plastid-lipid-associated protein 11, chloroplastic isoform X2 [Macadamia integrifolia]XP_042484003.1 probable plastid-lipid-associated protein 11, chloroplastic isoform X2 [Macadamia integrifolia]